MGKKHLPVDYQLYYILIDGQIKTFTCGLSDINIHSPRWANIPFTCGLSANIHSPR